MMIILNNWAGKHNFAADTCITFLSRFRQSLQCKEATPPLQSKKFPRPPSCARRHLVFDADTQFNSIDSGFVDEYILQSQTGEEQVMLQQELVKVYIFFRLILYIRQAKSYDMTKKFCSQTDLIN